MDARIRAVFGGLRRVGSPAKVDTLPRAGGRGQAIVLFAIVLAALCGAMAIVLDVGLLRKANQDLWNSLDAGALAGVAMLPADAPNAERLARDYVADNFPTGASPSTDLDISYRCLVGVDKAGGPRLTDVPAVCDPPAGSTWTCNSKICTAVCEPKAGDTCNTIVVTSPTSIDYNFGPVLDVFGGNVATKQAAACKGPCGAAPETPVDLVMVVDRTSSMNGVDTENVRSAADAVRKAYDPAIQRIGYGMLGPSRATTSCTTAHDSVIGQALTPTDVPRWVPVGISGTGAPVNEDYRSSTSKLAKAIGCFANSSTGTDLADPTRMATYVLDTTARKGVTLAILLMTDGQPNASTTKRADYCQESFEAAAAAKAKGIQVITVGFGLDGSNNILCPDTSGPWKNKYASQLLAAMATDLVDAGCPGTSNGDGDHYYCVPKTKGASTDLSNIFKAAVGQIAGKTKLIQLP